MQLGSAYALHGSNGLVKIGSSINPKRRIRNLETQMGGESFNSFYTDLCSNYRNIETDAHEYFKNHRVLGEWFKIDFTDAVCFLLNSNLIIPTENEIKESNDNIDKIQKEIISNFRSHSTTKTKIYEDEEEHCKWCNIPKMWTTKIDSFKEDEQELHCELQSKYYDLLSDRENDLSDLQLRKECYDLFISFGIKNKEEVYEEFKEIDEDLGLRPNHWEHVYHKKYHTVKE